MGLNDSLPPLHSLPFSLYLQGPALRSQKFDEGWREKYCRQLITSLSASRLAKSICAQFRARIMASHDTFLHAIKQLELRHSGRLKETEGQREIIRKVKGVWLGGRGRGWACTGGRRR